MGTCRRLIKKEWEIIGMRIVVLDGYTENPGDLSWSGLEALGDVTIYDRTMHQLLRKELAMRR